jgi:hypothetical protein
MALAIVVIAAAAILCSGTGVFDPRYQGHSAHWWLDQVNPGDAESVIEPQIAAFRAMGPRAIRFLGRTWASSEVLHTESMERRQASAARILNGLGADAAPALPSLVRIFRRPSLSDDDTFAVSTIMAQIAPDKLEFLIPELISDLNAPHTNGLSQIEADIRVLNAIGPKAKSAIPALLPFVRSGDGLTTSAVTVALWNIGRETNVLIECLSNSLSQHGNGARQLLWDLHSCIPLPNCITPVLEQALRHPQPSVRKAAQSLLHTIAPDRLHQISEELNHKQDELLQNHLRLLQSTNALDRRNAAMAFQFFGPKAAAAAPRLGEILGLPQPLTVFDIGQVSDKSVALLALNSIGSNAAVATPALVGLLRSNQFASQACDVLASIGPGAAEAVPMLRDMLATNPSPGKLVLRATIAASDLRWKVAGALAAIGPYDANLIAMLREAGTYTTKRSPPQRVSPGTKRETREAGDWSLNRLTHIPSAITLWKLGLETNPPLDELIAEGDSWAFDRLAEIGPAAKKALPMLETRLEQDRFSFGAALAIWKIDPDEATRLGLPGLFIICPNKY